MNQSTARRGVVAPDGPMAVAEMSGNHNGDLGQALRIVDAAAEGGAWALKIQTYTADTITIDVDTPPFRIPDDHDLWGGRNLYSLYDQAHTPWEWHAPIFERARQHGLVPFSAPFDHSAVEFLETLDAPLYKVASAEIVDLPLIREIARTRKPMIISTGMATLSEIEAALSAARSMGCDDVTLLVCTASYPADASDARLGNLAVLREAFGVPVGLSDHTPGIGVAVAAVALGATVIEKHLTLDRSAGGVDSEFSLTPGEFRVLCMESKRAFAAVKGRTQIGPTASEASTLRLRRSLYVVEDVVAGDIVSETNVRSIRPAGGLSPDDFGLVDGRVFRRPAGRGTPLTWDLL